MKPKPTGIFVTEDELKSVRCEYSVSGMWLSGGTPMGDPERRVKELTENYNPPPGAGLNIQTGEFMLP